MYSPLDKEIDEALANNFWCKEDIVYLLKDADTDEIIDIATDNQIIASFSKEPEGIILVKGRECYVDE